MKSNNHLKYDNKNDILYADIGDRSNSYGDEISSGTILFMI